MDLQIYEWMKNLAVFYIFLTVVTHLVPDGRYEEYIRFFMGLLLIYMVCIMLCTMAGKSSEMIRQFSTEYNAEITRLKLKENKNLQSFYINEEYEKEIRKIILEILKSTGIKKADAAVHIEGENLSAEIYLQQKITEEQEGRLENALWQKLGIGKENCQIIADRNGKTTVGSAASDGNSSGSDRISDLRRKQ